MINIVNFRDLGGLITKSGKRIQKDRILRSGELANVSDEDRSLLLNQYNLKHIVDFRSEKEVLNTPDDAFEGVLYHNIDIMRNIENRTSKKSFFRKQNSEDSDPMVEVYRSIITNETASKGYKTFIDILLSSESGSTLFHCFAGKDRTGIAAAILLTLLDVDESLIMEDYLRTNALRKEANEEILRSMLQEGYSPYEINKMETFLSVTPEYLETAYQEATRVYGSFKEYITHGIGISVSDTEYLQSIYLESDIS